MRTLSIVGILLAGIGPLLEQRAAMKWLPAYFRFGISVFIKKYQITRPEKFSLCVHKLQWDFQGGIDPAIEFKQLSTHECAFRQDPFDNPDARGEAMLRAYGKAVLRSYTPAVHGLLRLNTQDQNTLTVIVHMNWSDLFFLLAIPVVMSELQLTPALLVFTLGLMGYLVVRMLDQVNYCKEVGLAASRFLK